MYHYEVSGTSYTNNDVSYHGCYSKSAEPAEKECRHYHPGTKVPVSYDPRKPRVSVLEPGPAWWNYLVVVIAVPFAMFVVVLLVLSYRETFFSK